MSDALSEQSTDTSVVARDEECVCRGNWRQLVKEYGQLIGRRYRNGEGTEATFFGLVHADDDYYYGMNLYQTGDVVLLSCVGSIEGFGYELMEVPEPSQDVAHVK